MKLLLLVAFLISVSGADTEWENYKAAYKKVYSGKNDKERYKQFKETLTKIGNHNRKYEKGEVRFSMAVNEFTDWFPHEFDKLATTKWSNTIRKKYQRQAGSNTPKEKNWAAEGAVTDVKNQGRWGTGYAFAATGALEGLMFRTNNTIADLSAQEIVDCTYKEVSNDTTLYDVFKYVSQKKGIASADKYSYVGKKKKCEAKPNAVSCKGFLSVRTEDDLEDAVGTVGPVAVGLRLPRDFTYYEYGVYEGPCHPQSTHAMLVVGYGHDPYLDRDYWLLKNSWGEDWGESGFVRILRNNNHCKIANDGILPF